MFSSIVTMTAALIALAGVADAQSRPANDDAETRAIESYRLTLPVLQTVAAANKAFAAALKNDPAAQRQLEKDDAESRRCRT